MSNVNSEDPDQPVRTRNIFVDISSHGRGGGGGGEGNFLYMA